MRKDFDVLVYMFKKNINCWYKIAKILVMCNEMYYTLYIYIYSHIYLFVFILKNT